MHDPNGNDKQLFKLIFKHYDSIAYQRLVQLHSRRPSYGLSYLIKRATEVWHALQELHQLANEADTLVLALKEELEKTLRSQARDSLTASEAHIANHEKSSMLSPAILTAAVFKPPESELATNPHPMLSKSFSAAEEALARRGHARAATFSEADYTINTNNIDIAQLQPTHSIPRSGARRKGPNVPRVFTGSFSQLESDIRRLQLDKVETPEEQTIKEGNVKVRDFGASPQISPCPTPGIPLQRREALVSRDTEVQDRVFRGEVVTTRRPSTKARAQTIDGGLEAWLKQDSPNSRRSKTEAMSASAVQRGNARHRENTL